MVQGDRDWGLWSAHHPSSLQLLPPHTLPLLQYGVPPINNFYMGPSHRVQLLMDCSSMGTSWGHKSCQQTCSSVGSSPRGYSSCQKLAPAHTPHGVTASSGHPPALVWGLPWASGGDLLPCGSPWAAETACPAMVCSTGCRGMSAPVPGALPALLLH